MRPWIVLALSFLVISVCLLGSIGGGMEWGEDTPLGFIPGAVVALICFAVLLKDASAKSGSLARRLWMAALLWSLLIGGFVVYATKSSYKENMKNARFWEERWQEHGDPQSAEARGRYKRYAAEDQIGTKYGWATLGFAGVSLLGLIISSSRKKTENNISVS